MRTVAGALTTHYKSFVVGSGLGAFSLPFRRRVSANYGGGCLQGAKFIRIQHLGQGIFYVWVSVCFELGRQFKRKLEPLDLLSFARQCLVHLHEICGQQIPDGNLRQSFSPLASCHFRKHILENFLGDDFFLGRIALLQSRGHLRTQRAVALHRGCHEPVLEFSRQAEVGLYVFRGHFNIIQAKCLRATKRSATFKCKQSAT